MSDPNTNNTLEKDKKASDDSPAASKPSLLKLLQLCKPEIPMLIVSTVFMVGSEATGMVSPLIIANAYDALVDPNIADDGERMDDINHYMTLAIIITLVGLILGFLRATIQGAIGERMVARLRCKLYSQILMQEIAFFDEHKSGELNSRLGSDTTLLQSVISQSLPDFLIQLLKALSGIVLMFYISGKLAGVALGGVIVIFLCSAPIGKYMGKLSKEYQDILGEAQTRSTESIGSMRTVQSFAAEYKEAHRYEDKIGSPDSIKFWWPPSDKKTTYRVGFFKSIAASGFFTFVFGAGFGFVRNVCSGGVVIDPCLFSNRNISFL